MNRVKFISNLSAAAAFTVATAMAPAAFAKNNAQSGTVRTMDDLQRNGWVCYQILNQSYHYLCMDPPWGQTYECHFGFCTPAPARSTGDRVSTTPNGTATTTAPATAPQTGAVGTTSGSQAAPH